MDAEFVRLENEIESDPKDWKSRANCMGVDPDLFFPERGMSTREAKEVCRGCVVREDCLEYALANGEKFGIWGGLSERERRRIRRARALVRRSGKNRSGSTPMQLALDFQSLGSDSISFSSRTNSASISGASPRSAGDKTGRSGRRHTTAVTTTV